MQQMMIYWQSIVPQHVSEQFIANKLTFVASSWSCLNLNTKIFRGWIVCRLKIYSKQLPRAIAKRGINLREVVSNFQRFSFSLRCLATGNAFTDLKFSLSTCWLLDNKTITEWTLRNTFQCSVLSSLLSKYQISIDWHNICESFQYSS